MNEPVKTMTFFGVALVIGAIAWLTSPGASSVDENSEFREKIFPDFTDSTLVGSLEMVSLQDDKVNIESFSVQLKDGVWTIPSHSGYPADAEDQVVKAAGTLIDLSIVKVVSKNKSPETYRRYGVMEPTVQHLLRFGSDSIGIHAIMKDRKGETLADLIIGKKVEENSELRYARAADQDRVVTVKLDPEKLSTKFEDWIETDLLKLSSTFDIRRIRLNNYSASPTPQGFLGIEQLAEITLAYDDKESKWSIQDLRQQAADSPKLVDAKMQPDEELNDDTLRELRDALDDLRIINVDRKPEAFRKSLAREGKVKPSIEARNSLGSRGFYLFGTGDQDNPTWIIKSTDGEVYCTMKDGVRYVLRFGNVESLEISSDDPTADDKKSDDKTSTGKKTDDTDGDDDGDDETKLNRYLFVMVEFDPSIIPTPDYEALPEAKPAVEKPAETDSKNTETKKPEPEKAETKPAQDETPGDDKTEDTAIIGDEPIGFIQDDATGDDSSSDSASDGKASDDGASDDGAQAETKPASDGDAKETTKDDEKTKAEEAKKKLDAEIDRVKGENENKKKAYEKQIADGKKHVEELNERFADWYYVISEDVYKKIHLGRDDIVKKKEKTDDDEDDDADETSELKIEAPNFDPPPIDALTPGDKKPAAATPEGPKTDAPAADSPGKGDDAAESKPKTDGTTGADPPADEKEKTPPADQPKDGQPGDKTPADDSQTGDES